jgi:hypothetical protein
MLMAKVMVMEKVSPRFIVPATARILAVELSFSLVKKHPDRQTELMMGPIAKPINAITKIVKV